MEANERIQYIIDQEQVSQADFAREAGINTSTLSHVLTGRNKASLSVLRKVIAAYPKYNPSWIMTGAGDILVDVGQLPASLFQGEAPHSDTNTLTHPKAPIPSLETSAQVANNYASPLLPPKPPRKVTKIIIYYDDNTFETFMPE